MDTIDQYLTDFKPISLAEMDAVALLDRKDTKFTFSEQDLEKYLQEISKDYYVLEVNGKRSTNYETLYFDTDHFDFYLRHHNEKLNRFKARYRKYVESNLVFFEVKFKSNTGRTIKKRIKKSEIFFNLSGEDKSLFEEVTSMHAGNYLPKLWVNYNRATFVNKELGERLTIDTNLIFKSGERINSLITSSLKGIVIAEVKQRKISFSSPFMKMMHHYHMRTLSMSKYCIGISQLYPDLKSNNFKTKILTLNKIINGNSSSSDRRISIL